MVQEMNDNIIYQLLISLGICSESSVEEVWLNARDKNDVKVMKDTKSGVVFLSKTNHIDDTYYADKSDLSYWNSSNRAQALHQTFSDDQR